MRQLASPFVMARDYMGGGPCSTRPSIMLFLLRLFFIGYTFCGKKAASRAPIGLGFSWRKRLLRKPAAQFSQFHFGSNFAEQSRDHLVCPALTLLAHYVYELLKAVLLNSAHQQALGIYGPNGSKSTQVSQGRLPLNTFAIKVLFTNNLLSVSYAPAEPPNEQPHVC
jgi:hypothetical protein